MLGIVPGVWGAEDGPRAVEFWSRALNAGPCEEPKDDGPGADLKDNRPRVVRRGPVEFPG